MNRRLFFIFFILFISCNKSSVDAIKVVIPIAPTNLNGNVLSNTKISLSWTDNSTNEDGFKVERKTTSTSYAQIATISKDITSFTDSTLSPNTQYIYRVYSFNSAGSSATYSNELSLLTKSVPQITTNLLSSIFYNSAIGGGTISSDGGSEIINRGVIWNRSSAPTTDLLTKSTDGIGIGTFQSKIIGLIPSTKYYIRAYAINNSGVTYGNEISFTTPTAPAPSQVVIGTQIWMKENLDVVTYRNGDIIPQVTDQRTWANLNTGAWCYYNNDPANGDKYGKLYNWFAVNDPRGLAPQGWHIPSDAEWSTLGTFLGGDAIAGGKMKSTGITLWLSPNLNATNESGFTGLPGSFRWDSDGLFYTGGETAVWWSASASGTKNLDAFTRNLYYTNGILGRQTFGLWSGLSVRCIKD
jgi:uncharacterized protein (TIGR02145 family)